jgi:hypothetical protein
MIVVNSRAYSLFPDNLAFMVLGKSQINYLRQNKESSNQFDTLHFII